MKQTKTENKALPKWLLEAGSTTADIASYVGFVDKLISQFEIASSIKYITTEYSVNTPEGQIPVAFATYGNQLDGKEYFVVTAKGEVVVDDAIYSEVDGEIVKSTIALVEVDEGTDLTGKGYKSVTRYIGGTSVFSHYNEDKEVERISTELIKATVSIEGRQYKCKNIALPSVVTPEFLQDIKNLFSVKDAKIFVRTILTSSLYLQVEQAVFGKLQAISTKLKPIILKSNTSDKSGLNHTLAYLYFRLNSSIGRISTATKVKSGYFCVASSNVCAGLMTIKDVTPVTHDKDISDAASVKGILPNGVVLIEDAYSTEDYLMVGTKGYDSLTGGIGYAAYSLDTIEAIDASTFERVIAPFVRYDLVNVDVKGQESRYVEYTPVDMSTLDDLGSIKK